MKKHSILCSIVTLCTMLLGMVGFAQTTYIFNNYPRGEQYAQEEVHVLDNDVTVITTECYFNQQLRVYSNTAHDGFFYTNGLPLYIDSLAFNMGYNVDNVNIYGSTDGNIWTLVGSISVTSTSYANYGLSFGSNNYNYFKFDVAGDQQIRVASMTIFYKSSGPSGNTAATPTFSPAPGLYTNPISVSIASGTVGASIYYTTDGTMPTTSSTLYSAPISLSQTTTVKAIATASGYINSPAATATYIFPETVDNIAEFKALSDGSQYHVIDNDVTFVFNHGAYTYVKDASAALLVYGGSYFSNMTEGDQISNLTGKHAVFYGQVEMKEVLQPAAPTSNIGAAVPMVITVNDILTNYDMYDAQLVTLENVLFPDGFDGSSNTATIVQNGDTMLLYNQFGIDTVLAANTTTNLTGFVAIHNSQKQIYPRYNSDLSSQAPVLLPSLAITAPANGSNYYTLDTLPIGVNIQNFELGTDGYLKVETPLLTTIGLTNPAYLDQTGLNMLLAATLSPLPAGTHTITCSLVDMEYAELNPAVSATTTFTVVAPEQNAPTITAAGSEAEGDNTFYFNAEVTISADEGASIYYTTDGTEPTDTSTLYTAPFPVTTTSTINAIAVKPYYQNSNVSTLVVTITSPTVETPVFTPGTGTYADSVVFSITCATEGAEIHYTMDGSEPTETSTLYSTPIPLTTTTTIKAKAFKTNWFPSETVTAVYTVVYDPVLTVDATTLNFTSTQLSQSFTVSGAHLDNTITMTCSDPHFTLTPATINNPNSNTVVTVVFDGTEPATGTITLASDTLSAQIALTATAQLPAPVLDPVTGEDTLVTVTMSCTVADATIHYTTDDTEPTATSATYTTPVALNIPGTYTVKAIAVKAGWENSEMTIGTYIINEPPAPQPLDTIIYTVGFEAEEGFAATDTYNNTEIAYSGPAGHQWGTYYGTPSTTSPITGSQSMHMRWYTSSVSNVGYTFTNFDLRNVTHVSFLAKNSNGLKVRVSHSIDGGNTYSTGEVFSVGSTAQTFDYVVDENGSNEFVRLKFSIELPENNPSSTSRLYLDSVVVYGIPGIAPTMASMPIITPSSGFFYDPQAVSITSETEDAVIRYTTDGSEPTENSTLYTVPFTVSATTTVKAKAWKTDLAPSFTATANISFPAQVDNIAAFKDAASNEPQRIMSDVTFVFRSGRYIFVEDNSAAMLIYDNSNPVITTEYNEGDVIQGGIFGRYTLYNGMVEMVPTHNAAEATGTPVTVTPTVATVANVINDYAYATVYESKLVRLNDVVFIDAETFVQNGDTMSIRDRFNTVDIEISAGDHADVIGFVSYATQYGYQIYPRDNNDIIISTPETVATPVFHMQRDGEFYRMTITCETEDASIYYSIDGTDPDENSYEYTDAVPFHLNVHYVIKAIAMKEGMNNSAIATYDYDPVGINQYELRDNLVVYPNPAVNNVTISAKDNNIVIEKVELYNIYGQLLNTMNVNDSRAEVSVNALATGTYFAKIFTENGIVTMPVIRK